MFENPLTEKMASFCREIGIDVRSATLDRPTFFPGIEIRFGGILLDEPRLAQPGDILHEAGHIAVTDPAKRHREELKPDRGEEMATIAWSYAAALHVGVPIGVLFHPVQHNGHSASLIENFTGGRYFGVPLLQLWGMALEPRQAAERGLDPYPHMLRWLR
jgi:hypothetical protein